MVSTAHQPTENFNLNPPTLQELVAIVRKAEGAGGADGFLAQELRRLPAAISLFRCQALLWEAHGKTPEALSHSRMINMAKPNKVNGVA